jgi:hypothetical protein
MKTHAKFCFFSRSILATLATLAAGMLPNSAVAQYSAAVQNVTYESNDGSRQYCGRQLQCQSSQLAATGEPVTLCAEPELGRR